MREGDVVVEDLWGEICLDYWRTGSADFPIRRDDGDVGARDPSGYFEEDLADEQVQALGHVRGRVLDVGCGPGRHLLWLQKRGFEVTGIDSSVGAVRVARERGGKDVRLLSLFQVSTVREKFGTVLLMGNNMGLAGTVQKTHALLDQLREITDDDALLIGSSLNPRATDDPKHLAYHRANEAACRYCGQVQLRLEHKGCISPWFRRVLFEPHVVVDLLGQHAWHKEALIEGTPVYHVVARKVDG